MCHLNLRDTLYLRKKEEELWLQSRQKVVHQIAPVKKEQRIKKVQVLSRQYKLQRKNVPLTKDRKTMKNLLGKNKKR